MRKILEFALLTIMEIVVVSIFGMFDLWVNGGWLGLSFLNVIICLFF